MNEYQMNAANTKTICIAIVVVIMLSVMTVSALIAYQNYLGVSSNARDIAAFKSQEAKANADKAMFENMPKAK